MPLKLSKFSRKMIGQVGVVYTGIATRAAIALVIGVLVARWFGPEQYGVYNLFLATMIIFQAMFGESFDAGVVRHYALFEKQDKQQASSVIGNFLMIRLVIAIPVTLAGIAISPWVANHLFDQSSYTLPIQMGLAGALLYAMMSFFLAILQAQDKFLLRSIIFVFVNLLRLFSLPVMFIFGLLNIPILLLSHLLSLIAGCGMAAWFVRHILRDARLDMGTIRNLITFSKWSAGAHFLFIISNSLAVPMLAYFNGAKMAGIYAAGASLVLIIEMIIGAIMTVQLPALSRDIQPSALRLQIRRSVIFYIAAALLCSPLFLLAEPITQLVYGTEYQASASVLQILLIGAIASLVSHPLSQVFYAVNRPQLVTLVSLVSTLVWVIAALVLIPDQAATGAAISTLLSRIVGAVMIILMVWSIMWRSIEQS